MIAGDLGRIYESNGRRCIVEIHRFTNSLARQRRSRRIVRSIGGDNLKDVSTICETRSIHSIKVLANVILQQAKSCFVRRVIIDRVFDRIAVAIFTLPLQRPRAALKNPARWHLRGDTKQRSVKSRRFDIRIDLNLKLLLQSYAGWQHGDREYFRRDISRQVRQANIFQSCLV